MALAHSPKIVTDGLSLYLDAANKKSYDSTENLVEYSQRFGSWLKPATTSITEDVASAPDGTFTAEKISAVSDSVTYVEYVLPVDLVANKRYTFSVYVRSPNMAANRGFALRVRDSGNTTDVKANFRLDTVNAGTPSILSTGFSDAQTRINYAADSLDGNARPWYRGEISFTVTSTLSGARVGIFYSGYLPALTTDGDLYIWGAQVEEKPQAGYYTETEATIKSKSTSFLDVINGTQSSLIGGCNFDTSNRGAITLDGTSGYIAFDKGYTVSNLGGTVSCWMYIDDFNVQSGHTSGRMTFGHTGFDFFNMLAVYNGGYGIESNTNSNPDELSGDNAPENAVPSVIAGIWINMTVVMQTSQHTFYTNAIDRRTDSMPDKILLNNFGEQASATSYPDFFKGKVSNIQIYNRALTASEVAQNFNALRGRFGL